MRKKIALLTTPVIFFVIINFIFKSIINDKQMISEILLMFSVILIIFTLLFITFMLDEFISEIIQIEPGKTSSLIWFFVMYCFLLFLTYLIYQAIETKEYISYLSIILWIITTGWIMLKKQDFFDFIKIRKN